MVTLALQQFPASASAQVSDPLEGFNRGIFWFNDQVDVYVLEPAAKGWDFITPKPVQNSLDKFFAHIRFPIIFVNDVLQAKPKAAAIDVARLVTNTTIGFFGFLDPAAEMGLTENDEDFGQTLGYWGAPAGPYLVFPFWGPLNVRDTIGFGVDSCTIVYPYYVPFYASSGIQAVRAVNFRSQNLDNVRSVKEATVDYYVTVRDGYDQHRRRVIADGAVLSEAEQKDLYGDVDDQ